MDFAATKLILLSLILMTSYTLSKAGDFYTYPNATLWAGKDGVLVCRVSGEPITVAWSKGITALGQWRVNDGFVIDGLGKYNMTKKDEDFFLHIQNVSLSDAGSLNCIVSFELGNFQHKVTEVTVLDSPDEPFPTIIECLTNHSVNEKGQHCSVQLANVTDTVNLTCEARSFFPVIDLKWTVGSVSLEPIAQMWQNNTDGSYNGAVMVEATARTEHYVCTASGRALNGSLMSAHVMVFAPPTPTPKTEEEIEPTGSSTQIGLWIGIFVGLIVVIGAVVIILVIFKLRPACIFGRKRTTKKYSYKEVSRKEIADIYDEEKSEGHESDKLKDDWKIIDDPEQEEEINTDGAYSGNSSGEKKDFTVTVGVEGGSGEGAGVPGVGIEV